MTYEERTYRQRAATPGLVSFGVQVGETDLFVSAERDCAVQAREAVVRHRSHLEAYIRRVPAFLGALTPLPEDLLAPPVVRDMLQAGLAAGVGPMAAVAGAIAERVGRDLAAVSAQVVVENGGDLYLQALQTLRVGVFSGDSPFSDRIFLQISPSDMPLGIGTSSGTVGPSLSFGRADAACVLADTGALADAAATAVANRVRAPRDIEHALEAGLAIPGVRGVLIVAGGRLGVRGRVVLAV